MNIIELFLIGLLFAVCQHVVLSFKEGLISSLVGKEKERFGKLFKANGNERQSRHLDINAIGGWLDKLITDVTHNRKPPNGSNNTPANGRNPAPTFEQPNSNRPYPNHPPTGRPDFESNRPTNHDRPPFDTSRPYNDKPVHEMRPFEDRPYDNRPIDVHGRPEFGGGRPPLPPPGHRPHQPSNNAEPSSYEPNENGERCLTPNMEAGFCRQVEDCPIKPIITDYANFLKYSCTIGKHSVGVCCPANYRGDDRPKPSTRPPSRPAPTTARPATAKPTARPNTTKPTPKPTPKPSSGNARRSLIEEAKNDCGYTPKTRIVGGKDAKKDAWPWAVPIFNAASYKDQFCGAALISRRHVLTAAHCMVHRKPKDIFVRVGAYNIQEEDENLNAFNVIKIVSHPQYNNVSNANDISILTLEKDVQFDSKSNPVCIPEDGDDYTKQNATVVGWGTTSYSGTSSVTLKEVTVPVWPLKDCQNVYGKEKITEKQLCAGLKQGGKDSCQGDSGGPLLRLSNSRRRFEVIGVVSYGFRCAEANNPGVYTKVNRYHKWIEEQTTM